jgi:hypothetical protein
MTHDLQSENKKRTQVIIMPILGDEFEQHLLDEYIKIYP